LVDAALHTPTAMVSTASALMPGRFATTRSSSIAYRGSDLVRAGKDLTGGTVASLVTTSSGCNSFGFARSDVDQANDGLAMNVATARATLAMQGADDDGRRVWTDIFSGNDTIIINSTFARPATDTRSPYAQDLDAGAGNNLGIVGSNTDSVILAARIIAM
jgi:hypothetical protein